MKALALILTFLIAMVWANQAEATQGYTVEAGMNAAQKDQRLAGKIRSTIAFERKLSGQNIQVSVQNCVVTVHGELNSSQDQQLLLTIITQTAGEEVQLTTQNLKLASM